MIRIFCATHPQRFLSNHIEKSEALDVVDYFVVPCKDCLIEYAHQELIETFLDQMSARRFVGSPSGGPMVGPEIGKAPIINHGDWWTWQDFANDLAKYTDKDLEELIYFLQEIIEQKRTDPHVPEKEEVNEKE
jgi:hypothetical protein